MNRRSLLKRTLSTMVILGIAGSTVGCVGVRRRRVRRNVRRHRVVWATTNRRALRLSRRSVVVGHYIVLPDGTEGEVVNITDSQVTINVNGNESSYEYENTD